MDFAKTYQVQDSNGKLCSIAYNELVKSTRAAMLDKFESKTIDLSLSQKMRTYLALALAGMQYEIVAVVLTDA